MKLCYNKKEVTHMRILLAEDERDLNEIIVRKLTAEGYSVDACFDGEEAAGILS